MINPLGYEYICKIHTKKSLHRQDGTEWRTEILDELLGSDSQVQGIKQHLKDDKIGIIGPKNHIISTRLFMGGNQELISQLAHRLDLDYSGEYFNFIAGSMFWFKPSAIALILNLDLNEMDFPQESGQKDGTMSHALERLIGLVAKKQGFQVIQTGTFTGEPNDDYNYAKPLIGSNRFVE
jgi:lipopolysaccharide biosynthesis protein